MTRISFRGIALLSILLSFVDASAPVQAQLTDPVLARARAQLARYDFFGDETFDVISELGAFTARVHRDAEIAGETETATEREAIFLRSMSAADMTLLAHFRREPGLTARIAEAYGTTEDDLVANILRDLALVHRGVYESVVHDAIVALHLIAGDDADWSSPGERRDALYVSAARSAATAEDPIGALASLADDPCSSDTCQGIFAGFDSSGRRAIAAVQEVFFVLRRLAERGESGDPFSRALAEDMRMERMAFEGLMLAPRIRLEGLDLTATEVDELAATPDAIISVHANEVRVGFIPTVSFVGGVAALSAPGAPILPEMRTIPIPSGLRAFPRAIESVQAALGESLRGAQTVALGGSPDAEAHLLTRVWLSSDAAGHTPCALVGIAADGTIRGVPARAVRGSDESAVQVYVRLGGHTVSRRGSRASDIPRLRTEEGLRFDWSSLQEHARDTRTTSVRFMGSLPYRHLAQTAFLMAPSSAPLTLVLP